MDIIKHVECSFKNNFYYRSRDYVLRKEIQTSNKMRQVKTQYSHQFVISTINAFGVILLGIFSLKKIGI